MTDFWRGIYFRAGIACGLVLPFLPIGNANICAAQVTSDRPDAPCTMVGKDNIRLDCDYTATPHPSNGRPELRIILNHSRISFAPANEGHMLIELTFTNEGLSRFNHERFVYLEIDDDLGRNDVRRVLPHVELWKLGVHETSMYSDHLLVGAFRPGHYTIYLWIPSSDPTLKFKVADNFLLSSEGVGEPRTGLNRLASFTVSR